MKSSDIWLAKTRECDVQPNWKLLCSKEKANLAAGTLGEIAKTAKERLHTCKRDRHAQTLSAVCLQDDAFLTTAIMISPILANWL